MKQYFILQVGPICIFSFLNIINTLTKIKLVFEIFTELLLDFKKFILSFVFFFPGFFKVQVFCQISVEN